MRRLSLFLICLGLSSGAGVATAAECRLDTLTQQLWRGPLQELLADDLWVNDAYDAAHALLVPLHAAYRTPPGDEQPFKAFMARALAHSDQLATPGSLNRWQFLYLVTQYLSLRDASGQWTETDQRWADLIATEAQELWEERPVKWYNGQTFGNMRDLLRWKLETPAERLDKRYHGIVWDLEWYVMAASSDLYALHRDNSFGELYRMSIAPTLRDVLTRYLPVQPDGTVLYRPGVWSDYPDFAYAGYAQAPAPGDPPKPNPNVTLDSSHASRFGAWAGSWAALTEVFPQERSRLATLRSGLARTFTRRIYSPPAGTSFVRFHNYMDGSNTVYRWNYATAGQGNGYRPYELSGTPYLGWWGLLGTPEITRIYRKMAAGFPLRDEALRTYVGPNTTRQRHPLLGWPAAFNGGILELNTRLVAGGCLER